METTPQVFNEIIIAQENPTKSSPTTEASR